MTEPVEFRYRPRETTLQGERVMVLDADIPDRAPDAIKEASPAERSSTTAAPAHAVPA
jgi:hypothetical protein